MKLHIHIKKLFDGQNLYLRLEKKLAKENARRARGNDPDPLPMKAGHIRGYFYGFLHWRGWRGRGKKNAQGQLLPQTRTDVPTQR